MKNIFRKNQVIITALAIMIAVAGYLNFTRDKVDNDLVANELYTSTEDVFTDSNGDTYGDLADDTLLDLSEEDIIKEEEKSEEADIEETVVIDVEDSGELASTEKKESAEKKESKEEKTKDIADTSENEEIPGEAVLVSSGISSGYFSASKIAREQNRSQREELFMGIMNNVNVSDGQKQDAIDGLLEMTSVMEKENAAEILLGAKGFENSVVTMVDGTVDVVIGYKDISDQQRVQIEDAVKRKTGVSPDKIVITPANVNSK